MASKRSTNEIRFQLNDEDYKAFGHYRIMYTTGGRKMVNRQRLTYIISGVMIALLFTVFKVDRNFTILAYIAAAAIGIGGTLMAERILLRQQERAINADAEKPERVHPEENIVSFDDDMLRTKAGNDEQEFRYSDIKQVDMTDDAIYVWMSDTMIMPLPLHAFNSKKDMEETYEMLSEKAS